MTLKTTLPFKSRRLDGRRLAGFDCQKEDDYKQDMIDSYCAALAAGGCSDEMQVYCTDVTLSPCPEANELKADMAIEVRAADSAALKTLQKTTEVKLQDIASGGSGATTLQTKFTELSQVSVGAVQQSVVTVEAEQTVCTANCESANNQKKKKKDDDDTGKIIGGVIGGVIGCILIAGIAVGYKKNKERNAAKETGEN